MTAPAAERITYITAIPVSDMFADTTYQRELDEPRARQMAHDWQPHLVGVLDVSDRGPNTTPRYAIVNGQHRWAAARIIDDTMHLPVNVHTGLTVADEAKLFDDIDRNTRALTNWDRWRARKAAGDPNVLEIERVVSECGLNITQAPGEKSIQCCTKLETIWNRAGSLVLAQTLTLILDVWSGLPDSMNANVVEGVSWLLFYHDPDVNTGRLGDAMAEITPRQLCARAATRREQGEKGSLSLIIAAVLIGLYNKTRGSGARLTNIDLRTAKELTTLPTPKEA